MGVSENSVPLHPMVLLIIIPTKWLFHWEYTLFSDKPIYMVQRWPPHPPPHQWVWVYSILWFFWSPPLWPVVVPPPVDCAGGMYLSFFLSIYLSMYVCIHVCMYVCIHVCMYVCMYGMVGMYVCM